MKKDTHPPYFPKAQIVCACGNVLEVGSTLESSKVDICAQCHPFYTGREKLLDKAGRVEKFQAKVAKAKAGVKKAKSAN